jgi:hypothetical protein
MSNNVHCGYQQGCAESLSRPARGIWGNIVFEVVQPNRYKDHIEKKHAGEVLAAKGDAAGSGPSAQVASSGGQTANPSAASSKTEVKLTVVFCTCRPRCSFKE